MASMKLRRATEKFQATFARWHQPESNRNQRSTLGNISSYFTFRTLFMTGIIFALCYYGWPVIEAVLLLLPIPDPRDIKEKAKESMQQMTNLWHGNSEGRAPAPGYQTQFNAPGSLQDDEDDDEEDIGKNKSSQ